TRDRHPRCRRCRAYRASRDARGRPRDCRHGAHMRAVAVLALRGLARAPGRTLARILVLAAAVALLGAMLLFIGHSLRTMTGSAIRGVPLDWQGPVSSAAQAHAVAAGVARQPGVVQASATATAPFAGASHSGPAGLS